VLGFGWCHLRSDREPLRNATLNEVVSLEALMDQADRELWQNFRDWMATLNEPFIQWQFFEALNNHQGLLTYCVSRNHRTSGVWSMLEWIAKNGPGSYGLFYCHDDEDSMNGRVDGRNPPMDCDNLFRVHRMMHGHLTELNDPFFGLIEGNIDPVHPYNRATGH
jgi:hypothetical protein